MTPNLRRLSRFYGMIFLLFGTLPAWADVLYYDVTLNSSALAAVPDNYSLFFQLTNGDGINDTNNVVTLSNFAFGAGGAAIPPAQTFGGASGDLNGGASLNDSTFFFNAILEGFQPGSNLSFLLGLTTNVGAGPAPDLFAMSVLDGNLSEIPTLDPSGANTLLTITIGSPLGIQAFATDPATPTSTGNYIAMGAPVLTPVVPGASVPEPSSFLLLGTAVAGVIWVSRRKPMRPLALALAGAVFSAGALRAQAPVCPAGSVLYSYAGKAFNFWDTCSPTDPLCCTPGDPSCPDPNQTKNPFKGGSLSAYICLSGACPTSVGDVKPQVTAFSVSSGGFTITPATTPYTPNHLWIGCDAFGNINAWWLSVAGFFSNNTIGVTLVTGAGPPGVIGTADSAREDGFLASPWFQYGGGVLSNPGFWTVDADCAGELTGSVSHQANGAEMDGTFAPPGGLPLAARLCQVDHFNWQQQITHMPAPNGSLRLGPQPEAYVTAPPNIYDPPPLGFYDMSCHPLDCRGGAGPVHINVCPKAYDQSYPFYYSAAELANSATNVLTFWDAPDDPCYSGADPNSANPGAHFEFTTWLEGVDAAGNPVDLPVKNSWNWMSTFDGKTGGAWGAKNLGTPDPGSGTGGTAVLSVNGVPTRGPCANDATSLVAAKRGGYIYSMGTGRFTEMVTLTNTSAGTVTGPISLVLDNLSSSVSLENAAGATFCTEPVGSPYATAAGGLAPGQSVTLNLQFTDPTGVAISYTPRVLAGSGTQ